MLRGLIHYRHLNAAVLFGVVVAAAVLTGALMVGDSVRASLRAMTFDRIGEIDHALVAEGFIPADLADRLAAENPGARVSSLIMLEGSAEGGDRRATGVQLLGVAADFETLFPEPVGLETLLQREQGRLFPSAILNTTIADELGVAVGDSLVVSFENPSDINRDSIYGDKERDAVVERQRLTVRAIVPASGLGRFSLRPTQSLPKTVIVPRQTLQRALDREDEANVFLSATRADAEPVQTTLERVVEMRDLGLELRVTDRYLSLETPSFFLKENVLEAARAVARDHYLDVLATSSYLANQLRNGPHTMPYSLITAVELDSPLVPDQPAAGTLSMGPNQVVLSQWAADDLEAEIGDRLEMTYYTVGPREELIESTVPLELVGVLPMQGIAVDRDLTPEFPGIEDADNIGDWEPPFPMDMSRIRDKDEAFWDDYRTSSKIFVAPATGRILWATRFGFVSTLRMIPRTNASTANMAEVFREHFLPAVDPEQAGLGFIDLREQGLRASSGATDFTGLFIGLSFFIIASALLLVGLFFRLAVAQRAAEIGILAATGYTTRKIRGRFLGEGLLLCATGSLIGAGGGALYAVGVMWALRNWWYLGSSQLFFSFSPLSLVLGFAISVIVALLAIVGAVRRAGRQTVTNLIAGRMDDGAPRTGKRSRTVMWVFLAPAVAMSAAAAFMPPTGLFFGVGTCLLIAGLAFVSSRLTDHPIENGISGTFSMAARNMGRQAGRSLVSVSLVAFACYTIVAVGLYRNAGEVDPDAHASGAGGFFLEAEARIPIHGDLIESEETLGLSEEMIERLTAASVVQMRLRGGDDASCLNLFAPSEPRLLGVPDDGSLSGRFSFASAIDDREDPWSLLHEPLEDGAIPVIGDQNSMMWILKLQLGKDHIIQAEDGEDVRLRLVGMVRKGSVFQSELLMSEQNLLRLFPSLSGYGYFLFDSEREDRERLAGLLEQELDDYGVDAVETAAKIEAFHEIENTYISIFQMLGGLGLLLGTLGMGAVIYRNALERKSELAAMRAFGYRGKRISGLLIAENAVLLASGMVIGTLAAIIALAPNLFGSGHFPPILSMALTLAGVFLVGLTASFQAVRRARRFPLLEALRGQ